MSGINKGGQSILGSSRASYLIKLELMVLSIFASRRRFLYSVHAAQLIKVSMDEMLDKHPKLQYVRLSPLPPRLG